jgi:hypothetical protein
MYIVISKPKRISVKLGVTHCIYNLLWREETRVDEFVVENRGICDVSESEASVENNMPKRRVWKYASLSSPRLPCFVSCIRGNQRRRHAERSAYSGRGVDRIIAPPVGFMFLSVVCTRDDTVCITFLYLVKVITGRCPWLCIRFPVLTVFLSRSRARISSAVYSVRICKGAAKSAICAFAG